MPSNPLALYSKPSKPTLQRLSWLKCMVLCTLILFTNISVAQEHHVALNYNNGGNDSKALQDAQVNTQQHNQAAVERKPSLEGLIKKESLDEEAFTQSKFYAQSYILPVIKYKKEVKEIQLIEKKLAKQSAGANGAADILLANSPYHEKLNDDLYVFYVFDLPNSMRFVKNKDVHRLDIDTNTLKAIAVKNLEAHFAKHDPELYSIDEKGHHFYAYMADGVYESSAILMATTLIQQEEFTNPVGFIPSRGVFLLVSGNDTGALDYVQSIASIMFQEDDFPITDKPFTLDQLKPIQIDGADK